MVQSEAYLYDRKFRLQTFIVRATAGTGRERKLAKVASDGEAEREPLSL